VAGCRWIDLLDPDEHALREAWPEPLHSGAVEGLLESARDGHEPRPKLTSHGTYVYGIFLLPRAIQAEDRVYYQEIDFILDASTIVTVRKTPEGGEPFDPAPIGAEHHAGAATGMVAFRIVDEVAEGYLDLIDDLHDEIDELEDSVDAWPNDRIRRRLAELRHDLLHIRRTLAPARDAARRVIDDRVEVDGDDVFPREVELHFGDAFDKLLRATEGLESARDLIAGVRDYHQSKVANDQNEVMKRLTAIASLLLVPTLIVGLYGQNFIHMPELRWRYGYAWSWFLILSTTALQLAFFRRKKWI
jgi:magnesium transporter